MSEKTFQIGLLLMICIGVLFPALLSVLEISKLPETHLEGDMNNDGELTIKDLSILAAVINNK